MGMAVRIDHPGFVVNDLDGAVNFFVDVLGFQRVRVGELVDPDGGDLLTRQFGVPIGATARFVFLALAGSQIELLEWQGVEQQVSGGNSDLGGRHLAIVVADLAATLAVIQSMPGATIREIHPRGFVYVAMPFGLELQLIPS